MEKVLVCVIGQTRAHQLTWKKFKKHVLDELEADLALAIGVDGDYDYANPLWQHAKYKWPSQEFDDYGDAFDLAQRWLCGRSNIEPPDWRGLLKIQHYWLGGIKGPDAQAGGTAVPLYYRWWLHHNLVREGLVEKYDRFIITRSDFMWDLPHPPLSVLPRDHLWIPDGEFYWGFTDRHIVVNSDDILPAINVMEEILLRPKRLATAMAPYGRWNMEAYLNFHFEKFGLRQKLRVFPYVMYAVRRNEDTTRGAQGQFYEDVGGFVKYALEYNDAKRFASIVKSRADWEAVARMKPEFFHEIANSADVSYGARYAPKRLLTYYETVLYFDETTEEIRHDTLWTSPSNVVLTILGEQAQLMHVRADGTLRLLPLRQADGDTRAGSLKTDVVDIPQSFEIIGDERNSWLGFELKCQKHFVRPLDDGRVILSQDHGPWCRFKPVGSGQWKGLSYPIGSVSVPEAHVA